MNETEGCFKPEQELAQLLFIRWLMVAYGFATLFITSLKKSVIKDTGVRYFLQ